MIQVFVEQPGYTETVNNILSVFGLNLECRVKYNHITIDCNTLQYKTLKRTTLQYKTVEFNTVQYKTVKCDTLQFKTVKCYTLQHIILKDGILIFNYVYITSLGLGGIRSNCQ